MNFMRTFNKTFFNIENFIIKKECFLYRENKEMNPYHVCYNVNDLYIHIMGASMVSVLKNNPGQEVVFHIFTDGYSSENKEKIAVLAKQYKCDCILYKLNMKPFEGFHIKVARFSRITYGRIYMPKVLLGEVHRFIYVDADAMCIQPLNDLWNLNLNGKAMAAVSETLDAVAYRAGYLKLKSGKYFNDGIMLVDVDEWEKQKITEQCFAYQNEPKERFLGQSQDVLNLVFDGKNYFLPAQYNVYGGGYRDKNDSVFIHWTGRRKPWQMVLTKFDQKWREYNAISPWDTITNILPVKKPENYHDFQQWGRYQKEQGNYCGYLKGIFWYAWLRTQYKLGI